MLRGTPGILLNLLARDFCLALLMIPFFPMGLAAQPGSASIFRNTDPSVAYMGSQSCGQSGCHAEINREYFSTPHGQSMAAANSPRELARVPKPVTVFNQKDGRFYVVYQKDGALYQAAYELDSSGHKMYHVAHKLDYVAGGENTGYSYLFRVGNWMFQAPLSYYAPSKTWELSPGYAADDVGFTRGMTTGCLVCHNGQPVPVNKRDGLYKDPPFRFGELGISCESCHGPGALHVHAMQANKGRRLGPKEADLTIVNPAKLSPRLANDLCQECHQAGSAVVLNPGKEYMDYRPGTPLSDTMNIVQRPLTDKERAEANRLETQAPVRGSLEEPLWWKTSTMELSKCYQASHGRLTCGTCHSIHYRPRSGGEKAAYRAACLTCHTVTSCTLKPDDGKRVAAGDYCVECHMERRPIAGIAHSVDTKHRIVRHPGQPLPEVAFERPKPDLPGLLWLNRPAEDAVFPDDAQLEAYWTAARTDPALWPLWFAKLNAMSKTAADDPLVLNYLGALALAEKKDDAAAAEDFARALALGSEESTTFLNLAMALRGMGRGLDAEAVLQRGVAAYPYDGALVARLALQYAADGKTWRAEDAIGAYRKVFPEDALVRKALQGIESGGKPGDPSLTSRGAPVALPR
jgi:hypothetical protein